MWLVARFDEVQAALRDPRLSSEAVPREVLPREIAEGMMFYMDAPESHAAARRVRAGVRRLRAWSSFACGWPRSSMTSSALAPDREWRIVEELGAAAVAANPGRALGLFRKNDLPRLQRWSDELCALVDVTRALGGASKVLRVPPARCRPRYVRALPKRAWPIATREVS